VTAVTAVGDDGRGLGTAGMEVGTGAGLAYVAIVKATALDVVLDVLN
jgi:hypothetical protein